VTTRSVLIYVQHKDAAFREFHRVLRPGGRVSIFEPINNYFPVGTHEGPVVAQQPCRGGRGFESRRLARGPVSGPSFLARVD
jgi:SAM-dependent methyltransferase